MATLARWTGDLDRAEDAAAEAFAAAFETWPRDGIPARPGAWLHTTARRKVLDRLRRDRLAVGRLAACSPCAPNSPPPSAGPPRPAG